MDDGLAKTRRCIPEPYLMLVTGTPDTTWNGNGVAKLVMGWKPRYVVGTEDSADQGLATRPRTNMNGPGFGNK